MKYYLKPDERPYYDKALKALAEAHQALFKYLEKDVLAMSHGPFSGVNEALSLVLSLELLTVQQDEMIKELRIELNKQKQKENK